MKCEGMMIIGLTLLAFLSRAATPQLKPEEHKATGSIIGHVEGGVPTGGLRDASVYILTLEQSKRLREMDSAAYARAHRPGVGAEESMGLQQNSVEAMADLVLKLPHTALGKSNSAGNFVFAALSAGRRYYIVAVREGEDGVFLAARVTPVLKSGQRLRINLRIDAPWEERLKVEWPMDSLRKFKSILPFEVSRDLTFLGSR